MWCGKCDRDLGVCICPDLTERLKKINNVCVLTFCSGCGAYAPRCKCPHPRPHMEQRLNGRICGMIPRVYARMENWSLIQDTSDPYRPPEMRAQLLRGQVYDDIRFSDGHSIITSEVVAAEEPYAITKNGTHYWLGEVDPDWEQRFPNARMRFFASRRGPKLV